MIEIKNLRKYFPIKGGFFNKNYGEVKAVENINFKIPEGEILGLVCESGSGYSIESNDVQGLQKAINEISSQDSRVLEKMGNNAKKYALENFSKESLLKSFNEVIQKI